MEFLATGPPELLIFDFADFYEQVVKGTDEEARFAASVIAQRVGSGPSTAQYADADAYLKALRSGREYSYLIRLAGRYDFDPVPVPVPVPVLREALASGAPDSEAMGSYAVFLAAEYVDSKWHEVVVSLVYEHVLLSLPKAGDSAWNYQMTKEGVWTLRRLGRGDLAERIRCQITPERLAAIGRFNQSAGGLQRRRDWYSAIRMIGILPTGTCPAL